MLNKKGGPVGAVRPFRPTPNVSDTSVRTAEALESIAHSLAALDHHVEILVKHFTDQKGSGGAGLPPEAR